MSLALSSRTPIRSLLKWLSLLLLGPSLLGYFLWGLDFNALWSVLVRVSWPSLLLAVGLMLFSYWMQAWRWQILISHLAPDVRVRTVWSANAIGWAFNTVLPFRAGNLIRPLVISRQASVPYSPVLFSTISEMICDLFGVLSIVVAMMWFLPQEVLNHEMVGMLRRTTFVGVSVVGFMGLFIASVGKDQARMWVQRATSILPVSRASQLVLWTFDQGALGIQGLGDRRRLVGVLGVTLLIWFLWLGVIWSTLDALHVAIPLSGALFMEGAIALAMMIPQAPGFLGSFQWVTESALLLWNAPVVEASAVAILFWAICFIPISICGFWDAWKMGLKMTMSSPQEHFGEASGADSSGLR